MLEAIGDLWTFPAQFLCVTTNGIRRDNGDLVMGAGIALEAKRRFPDLPSKLGRWVEEYGNRAFICREEGIITLPTKRHWRDRSDIWLIEASAKQVVEIADKFNLSKIALPRPGCGNGGLSWDYVKPLISDILDDRFVVVS